MWASGGHRDCGELTSLHTLVVLFGGHLIVGLVDGRPEALVTAPPPYYPWAWPVEGEVPVQGCLGDSSL